jgi:hypothetical protein
LTAARENTETIVRVASILLTLVRPRQGLIVGREESGRRWSRATRTGRSRESAPR